MLEHIGYLVNVTYMFLVLNIYETIYNYKLFMSKDESSTYLLFGQAILIEGYKSDEDKGLLTTKGYADDKAKYETYENILFFQNYRDATF